MSFTPESEADLARQISYALEDGSFHPLDAVQLEAPEDCHYFSDLESSLTEWSFCCGVAWALVRMRDPFGSSERLAEGAQRLAKEAWRSRGAGRSWEELVGYDRQERGPVRRDPRSDLERFSESLAKVTVHRSGSPAQPAAEPSRPD
jgi:hypothetical protein